MRLRRPLFVTVVLLAMSASALVVAAESSPAEALPASATPAPTPAQNGHMQAGKETTAALQARAATTAPGYSAYSVNGIDISDAQGTVNWSSVKAAGYDFALIKSTEGTTFTSSTFASQYAGAKSAGLYVAAYAFARPDSNNPVQQADYMLQNSQYVQDGQTLPMMLDLEAPYFSGEPTCWNLSPSAMAAWIRSFVNEVKAKTGKPMILYTSAGWWNQCLTGYTNAFTDQWLDDASWTTAAGPTLPTTSWSNWTFWQYSDSGSVAGVSGAVDQDAFYGSMSQLAQLAAPVSGTGISIPSIVNQGSGNLSVLYKGFDGSLWVEAYTPAAGWGTPSSLSDGPLGGSPVAVGQRNGTVDVFWRGGDGNLWHAWEVGGAWSGPQLAASNVTGTPAVLSDGSGGVDVLWQGANSQLWSQHYLPSTGWSASTPIASAGTICSNPGAAESSTGAVTAAWVGCNGAMWTVSRASATAAWSATASSPGNAIAAVPTPVLSSAGVLDVLYRRPDGQLGDVRRVNNTWSAAILAVPGVLGGNPVATGQSNGVIDVFWRGGDSAIWHAWFVGGKWYGPQSFGGSTSQQPTATVQTTGVIDVVFNNASRSLGHFWYVSGWYGPGTLGGFLS